MFQTFISRHNSNFFSDKLVLTSVTPASSAPVLQTPKATSSTLYFDSLDRKSGSAGMPRPSSYAVFCLKKKSDCREMGRSRVGIGNRAIGRLVVGRRRALEAEIGRARRGRA